MSEHDHQKNDSDAKYDTKIDHAQGAAIGKNPSVVQNFYLQPPIATPILRDDILISDRVGEDLSWLAKVFRTDSAPLLLVHGKIGRAEPYLTHYLTVLFDKYRPFLQPMIHEEEESYFKKAREDLLQRGWTDSDSSPILLPKQVFPVIVGQPPADVLDRVTQGIHLPGGADTRCENLTRPTVCRN